MKFKVIKIGGSALSVREEIATINDLFSNHNDTKIVVISAIGKTTSLLRQAAIIASNGQTEKSVQIGEEIIENHRKLFFGFIGNQRLENILDSFSAELSKLQSSIAVTKELTRKTLDRVMSMGEYLALELLSSIIHDTPEVYKADAGDFIITDSNYGEANPLIEKTKERIRDFFESSGPGVYFTQGYTGKDESGNTTTMGFESSNLTTALIADALLCKKVDIITNVSGIRSADPLFVKSTICAQNLSYERAQHSAILGLKLFYPGMIEIAQIGNIELRYRNINDLNGDYTIVSKLDSGVPVICTKELLYTNEDIPEATLNRAFAKSMMIRNNITYFGINEIPVRLINKVIGKAVAISITGIEKNTCLEVISKNISDCSGLMLLSEYKGFLVAIVKIDEAGKIVNRLHKSLFNSD